MRRSLAPATLVLLGVLSLEAFSGPTALAPACSRCTAHCCPRGKRAPCCARMAGGDTPPVGAAAWRLAECGSDSVESLIPAVRPPAVLANAPAIPGSSPIRGLAGVLSARRPATPGPAPETPPPWTCLA
ncbi:MAG TPA: hypothetical protein VKL61_10825 [Candidatus Polarisedimenticolia bacterium]|nr:hypothetical protein [Candidatus Polarisedimenticolia bacterium]